LIGGVTNGIKEYLIKEKKFMESFCDKGRLKEFMKKFKVYLVNPSIEVGLLGAEEKARRELKKKLEKL
jgi:glucokinase